MVTTNIYKLLYFIIHSLYTSFHLFYVYLIHITVGVRTFFHHFSEAETNKHFQKQLQNVSKRPKHLTVVLGVEETNFKDVAKLILWCITTQISFLSFYDYNDILKKYSNQLAYEVSQMKRQNDNIIWYTDQRSTYQNGFIGNKIHVKLITEKDGRKGVVDLIRNLTMQNFKQIDIDELNSCLSKQYQFPDPDMGLICGNKFTFFNYPPWQLRLTEFFKISHIKDVSLPVFLDLLQQFSECEQRLGK